jgi:phosphatidylserine/phosphatidylglycerophosphate/cardiolipin synthase-like enzyme
MKIQTVVTGLGWMGSGVRSVKSALKDMLREAKYEILLCAYSVTGGASEILEEFEMCLKRGISFKIVINRLQNQPQDIQDYFINLASFYPHCQIYNFNDSVKELHAKVIIIDRSVALIGSANLSQRGMNQNYELGTIIKGEEVSVISKCFDSLLSFPFVKLIKKIEILS